MQFYHPQAFLLLWVIPLLLFIFWVSTRMRQARLKRFGDLGTIRTKLISNYNPSEIRKHLFCLIFVFLFAILALARPQWGEQNKKITRKGVDLVFLLDTSLSMLAEDIRPNRLEKSKREIQTFLKKLKGDRVGMVAFAGSSFLQTPLTLDYSAFLLFLDAMKVGYIPDPGTSLNHALRLAIRSFPPEELKYKAIVLFTDGEDHEGGIEQALEEVKKAKIRIYSIGVGAREGGPIPLRDENGRQNGFKKDRAGQIVVTRLNQPLLEKIAAESGALFLPSTPGEQEVDLVVRHLETLGQKQFKERLITDKEDHYQLFIFLAFLFLVLEMLIKKTVKAKPQAVLAILGFFLFSGFLDSPTALNEKGNAFYKEKKYQSAVESYQKAQVRRPDDPTIRYNLATTLYQVDSYQEAAKQLEKSISTAKDPNLKANALYNFGNTQYRLGNFEKAIEAYQQALEINPKDTDAKYNLEFLQKQKSNFEKKNEDRKNDKQQQNQQQNQQQQQQNQQQNQQQQQDQQQKQDQQQQQQQNQQQDQQQDQQQQDQQQKQGEQQDQKQGEEEQEQQDQQSQQEKQDKPDQGEQQKEQQQQQDKTEQQQEEPQQGPEQKEQPQPGEDEKRQGPSPQPLQGQMTMESALRVLDALKASEKDLQDLRRPPVDPNQTPPAKDW